MNLKIDILDLCREIGGMYNAVELLNDILKTHKIFYRDSYTEIPEKEYNRAYIFKHDKIEDDYAIEQGDSESINFGHGSYSYGYLKTKEARLIFKIKDVKDEYEIFKKFKKFKETKIIKY